MTDTLFLSPLLPPLALWLLLPVGLAALILAALRRQPGWPLRALALAILAAALLRPSLQHEIARPLPDIVIALVDDSTSQGLGQRPAQTAAALQALAEAVAALPDTELRIRRFADGKEDAGSQAMTALAAALAAEPRARIAGAVLISDGRIHDLPRAPALNAPLHVLLTGTPRDWDRRLQITGAPAFAILGQEFPLTLRIEDQGAAPPAASAELTITVDDQPPQTYTVPLGQDLTLPVTLQHGGRNVIHFATPAAADELTPANNAAVIQVNGIRDRLQVLLVSGEPHAGERVWRNLLKSDPSVDLVHFTILRPPEKQDGIPVEELALIAFPTRELFVEKLKEFDLIIFDRYRMRDILPAEYIENVVGYVREGGTVLVSAGPEYGAVDSLWRTPLASILPAEPTSRLVEGAFRPALTDLGRRHPVTESLESLALRQGWGRWFRLMEVIPRSGEVLMEGAEGLPLLILDRVGQGRIAVLASDQSWLWGRGYDGGGPQLELLKRLTHWMLKEPDLEEEALSATAAEGLLTITRRTIRATPPGPAELIRPDGSRQALRMTQTAPGRFETRLAETTPGLYRVTQDDLTRVIGLGPPSPRELAQPLADAADLAPLVRQSGGGIHILSDGMPALRQVAQGRPASGRGWIGVTPRGARDVTGFRVTPLLPAWAGLALAALGLIAAWLVEGRRLHRATRTGESAP